MISFLKDGGSIYILTSLPCLSNNFIARSNLRLARTKNNFTITIHNNALVSHYVIVPITCSATNVVFNVTTTVIVDLLEQISYADALYNDAGGRAKVLTYSLLAMSLQDLKGFLQYNCKCFYFNLTCVDMRICILQHTKYMHTHYYVIHKIIYTVIDRQQNGR